jgi:hypothetical protein
MEFVLDTPIVREFVADVEAAIQGSTSAETAREAIRPYFAALLADSDWLPAKYQASAPESGMGGGIGQWLRAQRDPPKEVSPREHGAVFDLEAAAPYPRDHALGHHLPARSLHSPRPG